MKLFAKAWLLMAALIVGAQSISATEWRGIVPLRSSRADIVRLFNECGDNKERCIFSLEDQEVQIVFSGWQTAFSACPTSVPKDTVLLVRVRFNKPTPMKDLKINLKTFKTFNPADPGLGYRAYIDEKSGVLIKSYQGRVIEFDYFASTEDQAFCPRYYENPRDFVTVVQRQRRHLPPIVILTCPVEGLRAGSSVTFFADTGENYDSVLWTLTEGTIVSGQGTRAITVDTTGLAGRKITCTVEMTVEDYPSFNASCVVQILAEAPN